MTDYWEFPSEANTGTNGFRHIAVRNSSDATWRELIEGLAKSPVCRDAISSAIAGSPFTEVFFEMAPLTTRQLDRPVEFVLIEAPLRSAPDPSPFAKHLASADLAATFSNLRGDAILVAPTALQDDAVRSYLKSFLLTAPSEQVHEFWRACAAAIGARISERPVWVSTSGGGVAWLHLRLDDRPKYYSHTPYCSRPT